MKKTTIIVLAFAMFTAFSCGSSAALSEQPQATSSHEEVQNEKVNTSSALHDIWALTHLGGDVLEISATRPNLEINLTTMKIHGNAGCNNYFGEIKSHTETVLEFTNIGMTEKFCPSFEMEQKYTEALMATKQYQIKGYTLLLFAADEKELLRFRKVD